MDASKKDESSDESSSETSSYHSENSNGKLGSRMVINGVNMELGDLSEEDEEDLAALDIDGETAGPNSYVRFKTQNEINPDEIAKVGPKFEQKKLDDLDQIDDFGTVV